MARADSATFACRGNCHRHGVTMSYEDHHVWPLGYHGPDTAANKVRICPNAHSETHHLLNLMLRLKPHNPRDYSPTIRELAQRGRDAVMAYAEQLTTPKPQETA